MIHRSRERERERERVSFARVGVADFVSVVERVDRMRQLETSSFQSGSFSRCSEFPCKSDCASIENRGTFTIFSVYPTERAEHAIGPLTSGLRHKHGRRHVGGHVGRSLFLPRHPFLFDAGSPPVLSWEFLLSFLVKIRKFQNFSRPVRNELLKTRVRSRSPFRAVRRQSGIF